MSTPSDKCTNYLQRYMGVATAVPLSEYEILSVDITKIGETKRMKRSPKQSTLERAVGVYARMTEDRQKYFHPSLLGMHIL